MNPSKIKSFIKDLTYDLNTVRYLLDYGRLKETLPIVHKILDNITSLKTDELKENSDHIFTEDSWNKRIPSKISLSKMHAFIKNVSPSNLSSLEEELDKLEYSLFITHLLEWAHLNTRKLRQAIKSPLRRKIEGITFFLTVSIGSLALVIILSWTFYTRDWGLKGNFYEGTDFRNLVAVEYSKDIDFDTNLKMNLKMPYDHSSAYWQGFLIAPRDGEYTLSMIVDDGARLSIDGRVLIDAWHDNNSTEFSKEIYLSKGKHSIHLDYYNNFLASILKLYWSYGGNKKEIIPRQYLRH